MSHRVRPTRVGRLRAPARTAVLALGVQAGLGLAYLALTDAGVAAPLSMGVPLAWITAGVVAVAHGRRPAVGGRRRALAAVLGAGYGLGLAWAGGLVAVGDGSALGVGLAWLPPWWGPALRTDGVLVLTLFPYRVVGYGALGYLGYALAGEVLSGRLRPGLGSAGGLVAVLSCVGCAAPLLSAVAGAAGVGTGTVAALTAGAGGIRAHLLGTAAYLLAVGLLSVRPGVVR